ncbi:MAG: penicillin-insensitive murein endopeptidase [Alphaproteobacteria bacterium]|nr:penicillin-insensitive murein endopeptidase [Alphaproteobacteria bacterium]
MRALRILGLAAVLAAATASPAAAGAGWDKISTPAPGPARSIGAHAAGCLAGGVALSPEGPGWLLLRGQRQRFWGHPGLIAALTDLGRQAAGHGLTLLIGDLGQPRGGPMPNGHSSHQTGLDADLWFRLDRPADPENPLAVTLVRADGMAIDEAVFRPEHVRLLTLAASHPEIDRVFVNAAIKKALCRERLDPRAQAKLRPWWGHSAHFHIRLACAEGDSDCAPQAPLAAGDDGCGSGLDWWFGEEARTPKPSTPPAERPLPAACAGLLK